MSMISAQCDELRKAADELQDIIDNAHNYTWSGLIVILGYAQRGLRQAADTVWELRNKLAGVVDQSEEIERLETENAKLRELAKAAWGCVKRQVSCDDCRIVACGCTLATAMRECGIEVGDDNSRGHRTR